MVRQIKALIAVLFFSSSSSPTCCICCVIDPDLALSSFESDDCK